jgi:predicted membrane protein
MNPIIAVLVIATFVSSAAVFFKLKKTGWSLASIIGAMITAIAYLMLEHGGKQ